MRSGVRHSFRISFGFAPLDVAGRGLAVFVDGPAHFARNDERARLGRSVLRNALLEARGLAVVSIREADWEACDDQVALLKARMEEAAVG